MKKQLALAILGTAALPAVGGEQPNIVLFLVDDQGWQETSVPFWKESTPLNERYRTPTWKGLRRWV